MTVPKRVDGWLRCGRCPAGGAKLSFCTEISPSPNLKFRARWWSRMCRRTALKHFVVPAGDRRSPKTVVLTGQILVKVSRKDTGGAYAVLAIPTAPLSGPPLHFHEIEDEWFYEGGHEFQTGEDPFRIGRGANVSALERISHTWLNVGSSTGKNAHDRQTYRPVGRVLHRVCGPGSGRAPDPAKMRQLFEKYAKKVVGRPFGAAAKSHRFGRD